MNKMRTRKRYEQGQASVEVAVSMIALVPLFVLIPYIGKYLDVKSKTIEAGRYAAFQRTIHSDNGAWGNGESSLSGSAIAQQVNERILSDPRSGILTAGNPNAGDNPLWRDHFGNNLVTAQSGTTQLSDTDVPVPRGPAVNLLSSGTSVLGLFDIGLGLNQQAYSQSSVSLNVVGLPEFEPNAPQNFSESRLNNLDFTQSGAVLTDPWMPGSESVFADRIDGLTADEALQLIVFPGTFTFGFLPPFFEGIKGQDADLTSESDVVPIDYIDFL